MASLEIQSDRLVEDRYGGPVSDQSSPGPARKRRHWGWIIFLFLAGVLLAFMSFWAEGWIGAGGIDWPWIEASEVPVVQSVLTNLGTGFMSTAVLFLFEPLLWKVVKKSTDAAIDVATQNITTRVETLEKSLEDRLLEDVATSIRAQDSAIEAARGDFTYESISKLVKAALLVDRIADGQITVQGTDQPGEFEFTIGYPNLQDIHENALFHNQDLHVMVSTEAAHQAAVDIWRPKEPFEDVAQRLHHELVRLGIYGIAELPPWTVSIARTIAALATALETSRVRLDQRKPAGKIAEIIEGRWAITDRGIESLTHDFVVPRAEFPRMHSPYNDPNSGGFYRGPLVPPDLKKPEWADSDEWTYLLKRASKRFTRVKSFGRWHPSPVLIPSPGADES